MQSLTVEELKTYINSHQICGTVLNVLSAFNHISFSDTQIVLYNTEDEYDRITTDTHLKIISVSEIESISVIFSCSSDMFIKLESIGTLLLFVDN